MQNREYFDSAMCDYLDVLEYDKPLMIVSSGKSTLAYETVAMLADRTNCLDMELAMLRCEDGKLHEHVLVARSGSGEVKRALELIQDAKAGTISRPTLQYELGLLLGYPMDEVLEFIASKVARECPCDCCGGPFVSEEITG